MKIATLTELKKELKNIPSDELVNLCLRLSKYKKENKELLNYLLFEADNEEGYIRSIKEEMDELFKEVNVHSLYYARKNVRKILRLVKKYIKYSGKKETEMELLIYFVQKLKNANIRFQESTVLVNLYNRQLLLIGKALPKLHEDLQFDYQQKIDALLNYEL
jgi:hypothetical protein